MSKRLQVLVDEKLDARLRKAASRRGLSVGAFVRGVLEQAFERDRSSEPLDELASLGAPTADIEEMLSEIESGRG